MSPEGGGGRDEDGDKGPGAGGKPGQTERGVCTHKLLFYFSFFLFPLPFPSNVLANGPKLPNFATKSFGRLIPHLVKNR